VEGGRVWREGGCERAAAAAAGSGKSSPGKGRRSPPPETPPSTTAPAAHSHFSQSRPTAMPGCLRHMIRSAWCLAMLHGRPVGSAARLGEATAAGPPWSGSPEAARRASSQGWRRAATEPGYRRGARRVRRQAEALRKRAAARACVGGQRQHSQRPHMQRGGAGPSRPSAAAHCSLLTAPSRMLAVSSLAHRTSVQHPPANASPVGANIVSWPMRPSLPSSVLGTCVMRLPVLRQA
jgi:hypothetical protein